MPANAPPQSKLKWTVKKYLPEREIWTSWSIAPFSIAMMPLDITDIRR